MNREETLTLFGRGRDVWNAWAKAMVAERKALETAGKFPAGARDRDLPPEAKAWLARACADFSDRTDPYFFADDADISGFVFPGDAVFRRATFTRDAVFRRATFTREARFGGATFTGNARFSGAKFEGDARFENARFTGNAGFDSARFAGDAGFASAAFKGNAEFNGARLTGNAGFEGVTFTGNARFENATFEGNAWFGSTTFAGDVWFASAAFEGNAVFESAAFTHNAVFVGATFTGAAVFRSATFADGARFERTAFKANVRFENATFRKATSFDKAEFDGSASFHAAEVTGALSLADARFDAVPDLIQAHFGEAPRLDTVRVGPPPVRLFTRAGLQQCFKGDAELAARWRALKRLAIQGNDHERELEFFAAELKARRFVEDSPRRAAFGLGLVYQFFSDFGRSVMRPLLAWAISTAVFAGLYQLLAGNPSSCLAGPGAPWSAASGISVHHGLIFLGQGSSAALDRFYACLYGVHGMSTVHPAAVPLPPHFVPMIPDAVVYLGMAQALVSAVFIFLILLALRNHFRIK